LRPYIDAAKCVSGHLEPRWGSLQRSPDFLAGFGAGEWKRGMVRARDKRGRKGREGKGEGR